MAPRTRTAAFSLAAVFVLAGVACAVLVNGVVGEVLTIVLISAGLAGALVRALCTHGVWLPGHHHVMWESVTVGARPRWRL